ncbi:hypothetical protein [Vibrio europaeus]|uniref:hypothetical protein n=1 Tax=Vibrio europaeus TaxID=300876 RepID=UPI00233F50FB|nr:hypothetical protein [Vibrio europaeus]MDC5753535.1 hypothetical protein [Vibrio europaeus]MDC5816552.1 hypothetical protein [Vibrio europaeus]
MKEKNESQESKGVMSSLAAFFSGWRGNESEDHNAILNDAPLGGGSDLHRALGVNAESEEDYIRLDKMPKERGEKYAIYEELSESSAINEALNIHITHALAPNNVTKKSFWLTPTKPEFKPLVDDLNATVVKKINENIFRWANVMTRYGVAYVRPILVEGKGLVDFEFNFYTLPKFIREYERSGKLAFFTSQHMKKAGNGGIEPVPPWKLIPLKIPYFTPDPHQEPDSLAKGVYSLLNDNHREMAIETQDYGESLLSHAWEPYQNFKRALESLLGSRENASKREWLVLAQLGSKTPQAAAAWLEELAESMKSDDDFNEKRRMNGGARPTVERKILPVTGDSSVDTSLMEANPNISHIEDVLFHFKSLTASLGLDYTMVGFADMMSGGLGEGGFLQTSIQAGRRAQMIRVAVEVFLERACILHMFYKNKKTLLKDQPLPWELTFNSMSSTIQAKEDEEREKKANRAALLTSVVDAIKQGSTSDSPTLAKRILSDALDVPDEEIELIMKELFSKDDSDTDEQIMARFLNNPGAASVLLANLSSEF